MKLTMAGLIFIAVVCLSIAVSAEDLQNNFAGIPWGTPAEETRGLESSRQTGDESYYTKPGDFYPLGGVNCEKIIYGYYRNQFFAAFMQIKNQEEFKAVRDYLNQRYGDARSQMRVDRTIYIWDYLEIKIKLKHYEERPESKLAFYYAPLSTKLNEARKAAKSETVIKLDSGEEEQKLDF